MMAALLLLVGCALAGGAEWQSYEVYQPTIERHFVLNAEEDELRYNHDSTIAWFKGRWVCVWNANQVAAEGKPGQLNYYSTSLDGRTWEPARPAFSSAETCTNPVPCEKGTQWQPNLVIVGDELWAVWSQNSRDEYHGTYVSRLSEPEGKWTNRLLVWDGSPDPEADGKRWRLFPTQNPVQLRSGRILAPVTMIGAQASDVPEGVTGWWATEKRNSVLISDDLGETWRISTGAVQPARTWAQWEPTVWELEDGAVMMFGRNNDFRAPDSGGPKAERMLLWSSSADGGETWTPHEYVPVQTVASRMHVIPLGGKRFAMVHNDWPAGNFVSDRNNLALFFKQGAGMDFVAGPGFTGYEQVVCYPQMWAHDDTLAVSYSQGRVVRSIKVALISPLPRADQLYVLPRTNHEPSPVPERDGDSLRFIGKQVITTRDTVGVPDAGFSAGCWLKATDPGVLIDTRSVEPPGGFVWALSANSGDIVPMVYVGSPEHNIISSLGLRRSGWSYVGVSVDNRAGIVTFYVDGKTQQMNFTAPAPQPLTGGKGFIGAKALAHSLLSGLVGDIRAFALYPSPDLAAGNHNWLHNRFAGEFGAAPLQPEQAPDVAPVVWLDPADEASVASGFELPRDDIGKATVQIVEGRTELRLAGNASAGLELPENQRGNGDVINIRLRFMADGPGEQVICTVGDANDPVRLVIRNGRAWLVSEDAEADCGAVSSGEWNALELTSAADSTRVSLNGGGPVGAIHHPEGTWVYLGNGYTGSVNSVGASLVDVGSIQSKALCIDDRGEMPR